MKFGEWRPLKGYLPALSIQQPWAWLIVHQSDYPNGKDIENRKWATSYRGPLLIHAGKELDHNLFAQDGLYFPTPWARSHPELHDLMPTWRSDYPTGGIVGIATLVDVVKESYLTKGFPWFIGPYGFVLRDAKPLPFTPYRGALGLFAVPESVLGDDESTLRARNIPSIPSPDLDNAYELTRAIEQAEAAKSLPSVKDFWSLSPTEQYQTQAKLRAKVAPGRCVIEVNGKQI